MATSSAFETAEGISAEQKVAAKTAKAASDKATVKAEAISKNKLDTTRASGNNLGGYNPVNDAAVGALDTEAKQLQALAGTSQANPARLAEIQQARKTFNAARWQSVGPNNASPGYAAMKAAVAAGKLTWDDVASIDISALSGDATELTKQVDALVAAKQPTATAVAGTPVPAPVDAAISAVKDSIDADWNGTQEFLASQVGQTKAFDAAAGAAGAQISSTAVRASGALGAAGASAAASNAAGQLSANDQVARSNQQQDQYSALQDYLAKSLTTDANNNVALQNLSTEDKLKVQSQAADTLIQKITQDIGTGSIAASDEMANLQAAIQAWKTAAAGSEAQAAMWKKVVSIGARVLMAGAGAALTAPGVGGVAGVGLTVGGISSTVAAARS